MSNGYFAVLRMRHLRSVRQANSVLRRTLATVVFAVLMLAGLEGASGGTLFAVRGNDDHLVSIDTGTFAVTDIGALGVAFSFGGLAYDPNSETLYMLDGRELRRLYTVNQSTGVAMLVGTHGVEDLFGLAFDSKNNVLYGAQYRLAEELYTLNTTTGTATLVGTPVPAVIQKDGLAYDSRRDKLVVMEAGVGDLYELNRSTAAATLLFSSGTFINNSGLAYDNDADLYWDLDFDGNLRSFDPNNGYAMTLEADLGSGLQWDGLAYLTSVAIPEPSTLTIMSLGLIALIKRRRRT